MSAFVATDTVVSWGRVLRAPCLLAEPLHRDQLPVLMADTADKALLAVGLLRSYGDSNLNPGARVLSMRKLDRLVSFDRENGVLRADAGLSLDEMLRIVLPHGWFPPVLPGTRFVTLGGAVANDVHGKNHHRAGTFGNHVRWLRLRRTDGSVLDLSADDPSGLFGATVGGLGLTGVIEQVELQLRRVSSALEAEDIPFARLGEFFRLAAESEATHEYSVAWIDCTNPAGRGIFSRANHATGSSALHKAGGLPFPFEAPSFALNPLTLKAFNAAYFHAKRLRAGPRQIPYNPFFFPLDAIQNWNRLYGRRGMYQYQCVIPQGSAEPAVADMLARIARSGQGSFLAVLKTFGDKRSPGLLSFPCLGATLALDFQNQGDATLALMRSLDEVVAQAGGRLYPAKDGRIDGAMFATGYPGLGAFTQHIDPGMSSAFWRRIHS